MAEKTTKEMTEEILTKIHQGIMNEPDVKAADCTKLVQMYNTVYETRVEEEKNETTEQKNKSDRITTLINIGVTASVTVATGVISAGVYIGLSQVGLKMDQEGKIITSQTLRGIFTEAKRFLTKKMG